MPLAAILARTRWRVLNPGWVERLSETCVTADLTQKGRACRCRFGRVVGRLDQCLHVWKKWTIGRHYVSPKTGDYDRDVYPIGIALARVRMAGMIKVMEWRSDKQVSHLAPSEPVLTVAACLVTLLRDARISVFHVSDGAAKKVPRLGQ